jgi:hypothetical protein
MRLLSLVKGGKQLKKKMMKWAILVSLVFVAYFLFVVVSYLVSPNSSDPIEAVEKDMKEVDSLAMGKYIDEINSHLNQLKAATGSFEEVLSSSSSNTLDLEYALKEIDIAITSKPVVFIPPSSQDSHKKYEEALILFDEMSTDISNGISLNDRSMIENGLGKYHSAISLMNQYQKEVVADAKSIK